MWDVECWGRGDAERRDAGMRGWGMIGRVAGVALMLAVMALALVVALRVCP